MTKKKTFYGVAIGRYSRVTEFSFENKTLSISPDIRRKMKKFSKKDIQLFKSIAHEFGLDQEFRITEYLDLD